MNNANAANSATTFQTIGVIAGSDKGVRLEDGSVMLQRQGSSQTFNAVIGKAFMEVAGCGHAMYSSMFFEDGQNGPQHQAREKYFREVGEDGFLPRKLTRDALDWIELRTGLRPTRIRDETLAYMFGWSGKEDANDVLLQRLRYDPVEQTVIEAETGEVVARLPYNDAPAMKFRFDEEAVEVLATDPSVRAALEEAQRIGFHDCDRKHGADYCIRRLTWLASMFYAKAHAGETITVFVLKVDSATPGELAELAYSATPA